MASPHDEDGGLIGLAAGLGILLVQFCAIVPGLLPALLLALPLVLPIVLFGLVAGFVVLIWRGIRLVVTAAGAVLSKAVKAVLDRGVDDESVRGRRNRSNRQAAGAAAGCGGS